MKKNTISTIILTILFSTALLINFNSYSQNNGIVDKITYDRYTKQIELKNNIINSWEIKKNTTMFLTILVGIFGILTGGLQSFKNKWCKISGLFIGLLISIITLINTTVFDADFREYKKAVSKGRFYIRQMEEQVEMLKYVISDEDKKEIEKMIRKYSKDSILLDEQISTKDKMTFNIDLQSIAHAENVAFPTWIYEPTTSKEGLYFLGISEEKYILKAKDKAIENAKLKAFNYLLKQFENLHLTQPIDLNILCNRLSLQYEIVDTFFQKNSYGESFNYYILIRLSRNVLKNQIELFAIEHNLEMPVGDFFKVIENKQQIYGSICSDKRTVFNNYNNMLEIVKSQKDILSKRYKEAISDKQSIVQQSYYFLIESISCNIIPFWYDTPYDFNGTSEFPGKGKIGGAYFVVNVLRDSGFNIKRKIAQQPAENIILTLTSNQYIKRFSNKTISDFIEEVKKLGVNIYIVGLDNTIGFIINNGKEVYFIHSSYIEPFAVVKEKASESKILSESRYRVIGRIFADEQLIKKWLLNEEFPIK